MSKEKDKSKDQAPHVDREALKKSIGEKKAATQNNEIVKK